MTTNGQRLLLLMMMMLLEMVHMLSMVHGAKSRQPGVKLGKAKVIKSK